MEKGENTTYIHYHLLSGSQPLSIAIKVLINHRDHHHHTYAKEWNIYTDYAKQRVCVRAFPEATPLDLLINFHTEVSTPANDWYYGFNLAVERYRGQEAFEDHLHVVTFHAKLEKRQSMTIVASTKENPTTNGEQA